MFELFVEVLKEGKSRDIGHTREDDECDEENDEDLCCLVEDLFVDEKEALRNFWYFCFFNSRGVIYFIA